MPSRPIADGLFSWPDDDPALIGGRCGRCERFTFPMRSGCPACGHTGLVAHPLHRRGRLWAWTSQGFPPKPPYNGRLSDPEAFRPWFVGLVELPGQLRLETILVGCEQADLAIGRPVRLVITPFRTEDDGTHILTFAFTPDRGREASHA